MNRTTLFAVCGTGILHAALIAAAFSRLGQSPPAVPPPVPVSVDIVQMPVSPPEIPAASPSNIAPAPAPLPQPAPRPRKAHGAKQPTPQTVERPPRASPAPEKATAPHAEQAPSSARPVAEPVPPAPAAASKPAGQASSDNIPPKTSASVASYAASNRKPVYPRLSRRNDEQGTVILNVLVKADGSAGEVVIKNSSGYPLLDDSARSTVRTWRFHPATENGKPVDEWYQLAVPFTLHD